MVHIFIGSESDRVHLSAGLEFLRKNNLEFEVLVISCHREPEMLPEVISILRNKNPRLVIAGAATATGLPGVIAGYLRKEKVVVLGVRFIAKPSAGIMEDASFLLSSMPRGVPLTYCGFNEKGFLFACEIAVKIL